MGVFLITLLEFFPEIFAFTEKLGARLDRELLEIAAFEGAKPYSRQCIREIHTA